MASYRKNLRLQKTKTKTFKTYNIIKKGVHFKNARLSYYIYAILLEQISQ